MPAKSEQTDLPLELSLNEGCCFNLNFANSRLRLVEEESVEDERESPPDTCLFDEMAAEEPEEPSTALQMVSTYHFPTTSHGSVVHTSISGGGGGAPGKNGGISRSKTMMNVLPNGKKTKGRVKIKMEYIGNKLRRYTTFSKRKTGIMKKAHELSTLTGTQVMLLVASETGHVYAFATNKLRPMIAGEPGKALIQRCLNAPDVQSPDENAMKTEFTFEPSMLMGSTPVGSPTIGNPRKRKFDGDSSTPPTMVPAAGSPFIEEFCMSTNGNNSADEELMAMLSGGGADDGDEDDEDDEEDDGSGHQVDEDGGRTPTPLENDDHLHGSPHTLATETSRRITTGGGGRSYAKRGAAKPMKWTTNIASSTPTAPQSFSSSSSALKFSIYNNQNVMSSRGGGAGYRPTPPPAPPSSGDEPSSRCYQPAQIQQRQLQNSLKAAAGQRGGNGGGRGGGKCGINNNGGGSGNRTFEQYLRLMSGLATDSAGGGGSSSSSSKQYATNGNSLQQQLSALLPIMLQGIKADKSTENFWRDTSPSQPPSSTFTGGMESPRDGIDTVDNSHYQQYYDESADDNSEDAPPPPSLYSLPSTSSSFSLSTNINRRILKNRGSPTKSAGKRRAVNTSSSNRSSDRFSTNVKKPARPHSAEEYDEKLLSAISRMIEKEKRMELARGDDAEDESSNGGTDCGSVSVRKESDGTSTVVYQFPQGIVYANTNVNASALGNGCSGGSSPMVSTATTSGSQQSGQRHQQQQQSRNSGGNAKSRIDSLHNLFNNNNISHSVPSELPDGGDSGMDNENDDAPSSNDMFQQLFGSASTCEAGGETGSKSPSFGGMTFQQMLATSAALSQFAEHSKSC